MKKRFNPETDRIRKEIAEVRVSYMKPNTKTVGAIIVPIIRHNGTVVLNTKVYTAYDLDDIVIKTELAQISCIIASDFIKFLTETDFRKYYENPVELPKIEHDSFFTTIKQKTNLTGFSTIISVEDPIYCRNALVNAIKDMCKNLNDIVSYYNDVIIPRANSFEEKYPNKITKITNLEQKIGDYYHHYLDAIELINKFVKIILSIKKYYYILENKDKPIPEELKDIETFDVEGLMKLQYIPKKKKQSTNLTVGV